MPLDYNKTLNLPKTQFPMRASLPQKEPVELERWENDRLYEQVIKKNEGKPLYVLHDGPPYANGDIHLGTALNKTLKDINISEIATVSSVYRSGKGIIPNGNTELLPGDKVLVVTTLNNRDKVVAVLQRKK